MVSVDCLYYSAGCLITNAFIEILRIVITNSLCLTAQNILHTTSYVVKVLLLVQTAFNYHDPFES